MALAAPLVKQLSHVAAPRTGTSSKQLYFAASLLVFTGVVSISDSDLVVTSGYLVALAILVLATVLASAIPWEALCSRWVGAVPVLDIVVIGLLRDALRDTSVAISLLVFIPAMWLAGRLGLHGVVVATLATTATITVPSLIRLGTIDSVDIASAALLPFSVAQVGMLVIGALTLLDTESRRTAAILAEKEELLEITASWERRLENIIDSVDVGIVVVDRDGHDVLMNQAQERIHQLASPADVENPNEAQLTLRHPGTSVSIPPDQRPVRRAVKQETFSNYVVAAGPTGGRGAQYSSSARQIIDRHGDRDGAVIVFADVTSYFEAQRRQSKFVAAVSHELRTPLTSVIGYLDLAQDDPELSTETASYLKVANRNAEQLLTIVEDLLQDQLAHSSDGELTRSPQRLSDVAAGVVESFALHAEQEGIALVQDVQDTPVLSLDRARLTQAIGNLLSNALKYTPRGGTVRVHTGEVEGAVELNVTDTGIGMSDQEQTDLFTQFYRTETARNSAIPGHGIGLSLTRAIVLAHSGQISVRSRAGSGSTFTIRLPLQPETDTEARDTNAFTSTALEVDAHMTTASGSGPRA